MKLRREVLVGAAALSVAASGVLTVQASADPAPGEAFLGYTLTAQAAGLQVVEDQPAATTHPEAEAEVPQSQVSLLSGPVGYALSSVAWPGALVANVGSVLVLSGGPEQAGQVSDPVRAETRTGGPGSVSNDSVPGATMHAEVGAAKVAATAIVDGGAAGGTAALGTTTSRSSASLGDDTATSTADSTAKDLSLADGVVTIASLVSHATATTDGRTGTGSGATTVTGMRLADVPVTVDEHGVSVAGSATPVDVSAVDSAMAGLGMHVVLSRPSSASSDGAVSYDAGSLVITWTPPGAVNTVTVVLGGARVTAAATRADAAVVTAVPAGGAVVAPAAPGTGQAVGPGASGPVVPASGPGTTTPDLAGPAAPTKASFAPLLAGEHPPRSAVALCGLAALLLLGALLRLPGFVLVPAAAADCPDRSPA